MTDRSEAAAPSSRLEEADAAARRAIDRDDLGAAFVSFQEAERIARQSGDEVAVIYALLHVAWVLRYGFGRIEEAILKLEEAKRRADATGSERLIWPALRCWSGCHPDHVRD